MDDLILDLDAVFAGLGTERASIYVGGGMSHVALRYAAAHPERVDAIVLNTCAIANASWGMTIWRVLPFENWEYFIESLIPKGLSVVEHQQRLEWMRGLMTMEDYDAYSRVLMAGVIEDVLPSVSTPVLVIYQTPGAPGRNSLPAQESMRVAASLPNGRFMFVPGNGYFPEQQTVQMIADFVRESSSAAARRDETSGATTVLSQREVEVLGLLAGGKTSNEIAQELVISPFTVNRHVSNIYAKIGASTRAEAAVFAARHGIA
jgi:DNA-binding NarL/FixJ family response regulator